MKEIAIQERIRLIEKEMDLLGESIDSIKRDINEQVAILRIELDTLKAFLTQAYPEFKTQYPKLKNPAFTGRDSSTPVEKTIFLFAR